MSFRTSRVVRYLAVIVGLLFFVGGLVSVKFFQISSLIAMGEVMANAGLPPEAVGSAVAEAQTWEETLSAVGNVVGVKSVALSNDAPGRVTRVHFESGTMVKQGQVLVELDTAAERAQLASAKSRRDLARTTAKRSKSLFEERVVSRAQLDSDEAQEEVANTEYAALQAQIDRKIVRAPFAGRLGIRNVNVGQYLNPGEMLTTLEAIGGCFVDFTLPQQQLERIKEGMPVRVTVEGAAVLLVEGVVSALDAAIDNTTRSIKLRAEVPDADNKLRPGMFVNVAVVLPTHANVVAVPQTAVVHASFGDSVFVIEEKEPGSPGVAQAPDGKPVKVARQQFVRLGKARGDFVAVVDGVKAGQEIVSAGAFKLRNGAPIVINNSIKPDAQLNPRPENH
ncbi:efflux RND transporter periplasmic adaptor subunit [Sorangium sp. So ce1151]|uniref:efflux RND transporter periplasmic adaptor subunit n=1 Tax=Sorangium sp. So ce1151 TaxID=3133332 RepID=UPI003F6129CE